MRVEEKTNEIPIVQQILPCLPVARRVYTVDALHTQVDFVTLVCHWQGDVVLTVKANQPTLFADLATSFADPHARFVQDATTDYQRGRGEVRSIKVSTGLNSYLSATWPQIAQVAQLTRTVTVRRTRKTTQEIVFLITTLSPLLASPQRLLALVRGHWCIENSLHYVRDVTFGRIVLGCVLAMLHRSWPLCAISPLRFSIDATSFTSHQLDGIFLTIHRKFWNSSCLEWSFSLGA